MIITDYYYCNLFLIMGIYLLDLFLEVGTVTKVVISMWERGWITILSRNDSTGFYLIIHSMHRGRTESDDANRLVA